MKRISESEKNRILELHRNIPMKPFLFEQKQVPFKNNFEGDSFRMWVNSRYPKVAQLLDLDSKGTNNYSYQNSYITKAWNYKLRKGEIEKSLGDWYQEEMSKTSGYSWSSSQTPPNTAQIQRTATQVGDYIGSSQDIGSNLESKDLHWFLTIASLGALLIPYVGPLISAGISAYDAKLLLDENRNKEASAGILFAILAVVPYFNKLPAVAKLGNKALEGLAKTLRLGGTKGLSPREIEAMVEVAKALKTEKGISSLNQGLLNYANRLDLVNKAKSFNTFKKVSNIILGASGFAYALVGAPNNPIYSIVGKSVDEIITEWNDVPEIWKDSFHILSNDKNEVTLMKKAIEDPSATYCGAWKPGSPVPLKYQTDAYKSNLVNIVKSLETIGTNPNEDCRFFGTFGRSFKGIGNDTNNYKLINGKYFIKSKGSTDWIDVTSNQNITQNIDKNAKQLGLIKDDKVGIYMK